MQTRPTEAIPLETVPQLSEAAERKARESDDPSVSTVVNPEDTLVAHHRTDDAWLASGNMSRQKADTAAGFDMPTRKVTGSTQPGESLSGLQDTDPGRLVIFGGYSLQKDGTTVGAIAFSGGQVSEDRQVAEADVANLRNSSNSPTRQPSSTT